MNTTEANNMLTADVQNISQAITIINENFGEVEIFKYEAPTPVESYFDKIYAGEYEIGEVISTDKNGEEEYLSLGFLAYKDDIPGTDWICTCGKKHQHPCGNIIVSKDTYDVIEYKGRSIRQPRSVIFAIINVCEHNTSIL